MTLRPGANRLWISCWVLAGFLVVGINGYALLALLDAPLSGYSDGVRRVDRGIRQCRTLVTAETGNAIPDRDLFFQRFASAPDLLSEPRKSTSRPSTDKQMAAVPTPLPTLMGILTGYSTNGATRRLVLLNGTVCAEGDSLGGLTVKEISARGVRLTKGGKTWFVEAPENIYSLTIQ